MDDDGVKDGAARLWWSPAESWKLGAGVYLGSVAGTDDKERAYTADLMWSRGRWAATASGTWGKLETGGEAAPAMGAALLASFDLQESWTLLARLQHHDPDRDRDDDSLGAVEASLVWFTDRRGRWGGSKVSCTYMLRLADSAAAARGYGDRGASYVGDELGDALVVRLQGQL